MSLRYGEVEKQISLAASVHWLRKRFSFYETAWPITFEDSALRQWLSAMADSISE